jgi:hypothetical protein
MLYDFGPAILFHSMANTLAFLKKHGAHFDEKYLWD